MFPADRIIQTSLEDINYGTLKNLSPLGLLRQLARCYDNTCLQVLSNRVYWWIYLEQGKIIYATNSVEPLDRLERHLRRLAHQIPSIPREIYTQLRLILADISQNQSIEHLDYQGICWLIEQKYLSVEETALLIQEMTKEVIESFLLIQQGTYELTNKLHSIPHICKLNVHKIITNCQERLLIWQLMESAISSPYQRPYLWNVHQGNHKNLLDVLEVDELKKGLSIRHLAVVVNQDELQLAGNLYPYIVSGEILLHEPDPPFDDLPKITTDKPVNSSVFNNRDNGTVTNLTPWEIENRQQPEIKPQLDKWSTRKITGDTLEKSLNDRMERSKSDDRAIADLPVDIDFFELDEQKIYTIAVVSDNPTILQQISQFLASKMFFVVNINQPIQDYLMVIRYHPDLILLDLAMAGTDGYELCRLIRNNSMFKDTPIVMMTNKKGILDRAKASVVRASGLFTQPFNRAELLKMIFTYLT